MIELPKKCRKTGKPMLSYSQISTFQKNKRDYFRQYFFNEPFTGNDYTEFGSKIGEALEKGDFSDFSVEEQEFLKQIPRYDEFEREILLDCGDFVVMGYIDSNSKDLSTVVDYKSGSEKKKEDYESDDYMQTDIYALAIEQETGKLPERTAVILYERLGNAFKGEPLTLGHRFWTIERPVTKERCEEVLKKIKETAEQISKYYKIFKHLNQ